MERCAGGEACDGGLLWDLETWEHAYKASMRGALPATGWYCGSECAQFAVPVGWSMQMCRLVREECTPCASAQTCADGACTCEHGYYEALGARCAQSALEVRFLASIPTPGPGALPPALAADVIGAAFLHALAAQNAFAGALPRARDVFAATHEDGAVWRCTLRIAFADAVVAVLADAAAVEAALWAASSNKGFAVLELGPSVDARSSDVVEVHTLEAASVRDAPSFGFRVVSRMYTPPRWDIRLRLADQHADAGLVFVLRRVRGIDLGNCSDADIELASATRAPCCVGALARAYHVVEDYARATAGCVHNASAVATLAHRAYLNGTLAGLRRSHLRALGGGLVHVVLFEDEVEATAMATSWDDGVQTSSFDLGIAILRAGSDGGFSARVVTQFITLQFSAALVFTANVHAGRAFTPVVNVTLERFALSEPVNAARDFVRIDVHKRSALPAAVEYRIVPASILADSRTACVAWDAAARAAYDSDASRAQNAPLCGLPDDVCAEQASTAVPLQAGALDTAEPQRLVLEFLVRVQTSNGTFLGRVVMDARVAWDTVRRPCPDVALAGTVAPQVSVGLHPALANATGVLGFDGSMRVPLAATLLLDAPAASFQRLGTEGHALFAEHVVLVFVTSRLSGLLLDRLLSAGTAWQPQDPTAPTPELLEVCPLEGLAPPLGASAFGCHTRYAVFHGVVATGADHALELTATPDAAGFGLAHAYGPEITAHAAHVHAHDAANARWRRAYLLSTRGPDAGATSIDPGVPPQSTVRAGRVLVHATAAVRTPSSPPVLGAYEVRVRALVPARNPAFAEYVYLQRAYASAYERVLGLAPGAGLVRNMTACAPAARACTCFELALRLPFPATPLGAHHADMLVRALADTGTRTHTRISAVLNETLAPFFDTPVWLASERANMHAATLHSVLSTGTRAPTLPTAMFTLALRMTDVNVADQMVYYHAAQGGPSNRIRGRTLALVVDLPVAEACADLRTRSAALLARLEAPLRAAAEGQIEDVYVGTVAFRDDLSGFCAEKAARRLLQTPTTTADADAGVTPTTGTDDIVIYATEDLAGFVRRLAQQASDNSRAAVVENGAGWNADGTISQPAPLPPAPPGRTRLYAMPCVEGTHAAFSGVLFVMLAAYLCVSHACIPLARARRRQRQGPPFSGMYAGLGQQTPHMPRTF
jgi:hypothetical protein